MSIPVIVGSDLPENRKMSKGQGFLSTTNQLRVSRLLSHILTAYDDGQQVNIPVLAIFVKSSNRFRISGVSRGIKNENLLDCNEENLENHLVSAESKSQ